MTAVMQHQDSSAPKKDAVVIKKYANRRLYNTESSAYVTLDDLAVMVRGDRDFVVYDAKTGDDLTHSVLTQIIVEQEAKSGGHTMLPVPFLRQLIRFYDDSIAKMVPSYLQMSLQTLVNEQERFRSQFTPFFAQSPFGSTAFEAMQEQTRKNLAMFEQAMKMWTPFTAALPLSGAPRSDDRSGRAVPAVTPAVAPPAAGTPASVVESDFAELKAELAAMQAKIEKLSQTRG